MTCPSAYEFNVEADEALPPAMEEREARVPPFRARHAFPTSGFACEPDADKGSVRRQMMRFYYRVGFFWLDPVRILLPRRVEERLNGLLYDLSESTYVARLTTRLEATATEREACGGAMMERSSTAPQYVGPAVEAVLRPLELTLSAEAEAEGRVAATGRYRDGTWGTVLDTLTV